MGSCIFNVFFKYNKQEATYTIIFITVNALHVSGSSFAHYQELKNCSHSIGYMSNLLAATASVGEFQFIQLAVAASKLDIYRLLCVEFLSS